MTNKQTALIEEMRMQGKGYKAIASAVGLSRDIVRNYCKVKSMEGYGITAALNLQQRLAEVKMDRTSQINAGRMDA